MINLIPNNEKKEMVKGFRYRLVVLFLIMTGICFLIAFVAILPAYFLASAKDRIVNQKLETQKNEPIPSPDQETLALITGLDKKLDILENSPNLTFTVSKKAINAVLVKKMPEIKITDISYENDPKNNPLPGKKISIQGTAPSREMLLLFRKALEEDRTFKSVDLPISNFIKGSNIKFYLNLFPA